MTEGFKKGVDYTGVGVVFFCHDGQGKFVMAKRSEQTRDERGRWDIGGGGLKFGETLEEALRREIREEYCADVLHFEPLGYRDVHREQNGKPTHWIALDFKVLVDPTQVRIGEPEKFTEIGWFDFDTVPDPLHSQLSNIFSLYRNRFTRTAAR